MEAFIEIQDGVLVGSITNEILLEGQISQCVDLSGTIQPESELSGYVSMPETLEPYLGKYEYTPRVTEQTLPTKDKRMTEDLRINAIPFFDVSNPTGGKTIYIGKEI